MSYIAIAGWISFGVMALLLSLAKRDRDKADAARKAQTDELLMLAAEHEGFRLRQTLKLKDLESEIEQLEEELESCTTPGSRRNALNRLLQKASSARSDAEDSVSG